MDKQLGPEYFGFIDPLTNTWRPKKYRGSRNKQLMMDNQDDFEKDKSGNGNHWIKALMGLVEHLIIQML